MNPFGWWIALYFSLATVAAGAAGAGCILLSRADAKSLLRARLALAVSFVAISFGMLALIADLEHPMDFWMTLRHYNPASWISRGSRIAMLFALATGGLLFVVRGGEDRGNWTQLGVPILGILAVSLAIYPSLVLGQELGRPNWQSPLLPFIFGASAIHVGANILQGTRAIELGVVALEMALVGGYLVTTGALSQVASGSTLIYMGIGIVFVWLVPTVMRNEANAAMLLRAGSLVLGCFGIRSVILMTGLS